MSFIRLNIAILIWFSIISMETMAQSSDTNRRICLTHQMSLINKEKFRPLPEFQYRNEQELDVTQEYYIIPVVIHVIHNDGVENLSDNILKSQIEVLNEDFGHYGAYNNDPRGKDAKIRFCLASRDPDGNPTSGIIRVKSDQTDMSSDNEMLMKNLSYWNPEKYLNIWVVKSIDGSSNIQGYSYMPSQSGGSSFEGDGIVIVYKFFGRNSGLHNDYHLGRTCTHEMGHYFDLKHPWGGDDFDNGEGDCHDDDGILDTPNCSLDYYSKPPVCIHPQQCGNVRMIENFMDYSLDDCMKLYTPGQIQRMISAIKKYRNVLVSYDNMISTGCTYYFDSVNSNTRVDIYPNPASRTLYFETHLMIGKSTLNLTLYDLFGKILLTKSIPETGKQLFALHLTDISSGIYFVKGDFGGEAFTKKIVVGEGY